MNENGEKKRYRYQIKKGNPILIIHKIIWTFSQGLVASSSASEPIELDPNIPFEPKSGKIIVYIICDNNNSVSIWFADQRCSGRNFQGRRCCTPENPCDEGEGDCDGPGDGGQHDGNAGCKGDLVCGSNNCKQFGHYYHEKDDCCEKPR